MTLFGGIKADFKGELQQKWCLRQRESHEFGTCGAKSWAERKQMLAAGTHWIAWRLGSREATDTGDSWGPRSAAVLFCARGTHEKSPLDWLDAHGENGL